MQLIKKRNISKKIISIALAASLVSGTVVLSSVTAFTVKAVDTSSISTYDSHGYSFTYTTLNDGTLEIVSASGDSAELVIPSEIDGKTVSSVGSEAFAENSLITSLTIPGTIKTIKSSAFYGCLSLKKAVFGKGLESIESDSFSGCFSLAEIEFPSTLKSIGEDAFTNTEWYNDKNDGYVYAGLVFYRYKGEMSDYLGLSLGEGTVAIADGAFKNCDKMISLNLPSTFKYLGNDTFENCEILLSVNVSSGNEVFSSDNGVLFNKDKTELLFCPSSKGVLVNARITFDTDYKIPSTVKSISAFAFEDCQYLKSIILPEKLTTIEGGTFINCTSLSEIKIPSTVSVIGEGAFEGCTSLKSVTIPKNVTKVADWTFADCTSLSSVKIQGKVSSIGRGAFYNCTSLKEINLPQSVEHIGKNAFEDTAWFDKQDDGVVYIGSFAYSYKGDIPKNTTLVLDSGCTATADGAFADCTNLIEAEFPEGFKTIGNETFAGCTNLKTVKLSDSTVSIGDFAFSGCKKITALSIPENTKTLGYAAFENCTGLKTAYIYENVTDIEEDVFSGCKSLRIFGRKDSEISKCASANKIKFTAVTILSDEETGIYVKNVQDDGTVLRVEKINVEDNPFVAEYRISLNKNDSQVKPVTEVTVGIPCEDAKIKLVSLDEEGNKTFIAADYSDGIYTFKTTEISGTYALDDSRLIGDVNGDGDVNIADALMISRYDAGLTDLDSSQLAVSDVNNDGDVNIADALMISRYDAGLIDSL